MPAVCPAVMWPLVPLRPHLLLGTETEWRSLLGAAVTGAAACRGVGWSLAPGSSIRASPPAEQLEREAAGPRGDTRALCATSARPARLEEGEGQRTGGGRKQQAAWGLLGAQAQPQPVLAGAVESGVESGRSCVRAGASSCAQAGCLGWWVRERLACQEEEVQIGLGELQFWEQPGGGAAVRKELLK